MKRENILLGQKVSYPGNTVIGPCTGRITKIFAPDPDDYPFYQDGFAVVEVDNLPENWPYSSNSFAPAIEELTEITNTSL